MSKIKYFYTKHFGNDTDRSQIKQIKEIHNRVITITSVSPHTDRRTQQVAVQYFGTLYDRLSSLDQAQADLLKIKSEIRNPLIQRKASDELATIKKEIATLEPQARKEGKEPLAKTRLEAQKILISIQATSVSMGRII